MKYSQHYTSSLLKYGKDFDHASYEKELLERKKQDLANPEGHAVHDNGGPGIYADWLEDRGFIHLPEFIRNSNNRHGHFHDEAPSYGKDYANYRAHEVEGKKISFSVHIPSLHSKTIHSYYHPEILTKEDANNLKENLASDGIRPY